MFMPLVDDHRFHSIFGYATFAKGRMIIHPYTGMDKPPQTCEDFIARYERSDITIDILYNLPLGALECFVTYGSAHRFNLLDLMYLVNPDSNLVSHEMTLKRGGLLTDNQVKHAIAAMHSVLVPDISLYIDYASQSFDTAYSKQIEALQAHINDDLGHGMDEACKKAQEEFLHGRFKNTIMLLRPYKNYLSAEDSKILSLALIQLDE